MSPPPRKKTAKSARAAAVKKRAVKKPAARRKTARKAVAVSRKTAVSRKAAVSRKTASASRKTAARKAARKAAPVSRKAAAAPVSRKPTRRRRWKWSAESRAKISESAKKTWRDPTVRARRVAGIRKAMKTPAVRERIMERSNERRGRKHSAATIRKMRASALRHRGRKKAAGKKRRA